MKGKSIAAGDVMKRLGISIILTLALFSGGAFDASADMHHRHMHHGGKMDLKMKMQLKRMKTSGATCDIPVQITDAAERQPGGASFKGSAHVHHPKHLAAMPAMKGAHMDHKPRHGGAFFMAPNKINHLESMFSERCGFQLVFYNAHTKNIRADRFRAFIKVVPDKQHEPEVIRFLSPNHEGTVLQAKIGDVVSRPFNVELYVKFPQSDDPQMFNIQVPLLAN